MGGAHDQKSSHVRVLGHGPRFALKFGCNKVCRAASTPVTGSQSPTEREKQQELENR